LELYCAQIGVSGRAAESGGELFSLSFSFLPAAATSLLERFILEKTEVKLLEDLDLVGLAGFVFDLPSLPSFPPFLNGDEGGDCALP
jgi:hypothetical protein